MEKLTKTTTMGLQMKKGIWYSPPSGTTPAISKKDMLMLKMVTIISS